LYTREPIDLDALLAAAELPAAIARVSLILAPAHRAELGAVPTSERAAARGELVDLRTYDPDAAGALTERADWRGLHPMLAERMALWRLDNFDLERLPRTAAPHPLRAHAQDDR